MEKNDQYYLSMKLESEMAEYFAAGRRHITRVVPRKDFTLALTFDNGETRMYDVRPLLQQGGVFAPFREWGKFQKVYLDGDHCVSWDIDPNIDSTENWSNKVDLCPDSCYVDSVPISANDME